MGPPETAPYNIDDKKNSLCFDDDLSWNKALRDLQDQAKDKSPQNGANGSDERAQRNSKRLGEPHKKRLNRKYQRHFTEESEGGTQHASKFIVSPELDSRDQLFAQCVT